MLNVLVERTKAYFPERKNQLKGKVSAIAPWIALN